MYFIKDKTPEFKAITPGINTPEIAKKCSALWTSYSEEQKKRWNDLAEMDKQRYQSEKKAVDAQAAAAQVSEGKKKKKKSGESQKGKLSSYLLFFNARREAIKLDRPDIKVTDVSKIAGAEWSALTEE